MQTRSTIIGATLLFGLVGPSAMFGQSNELGILVGAATHSAQLEILSVASISAGASASIQVDYAHLLKETSFGRLSVELPAARILKASVGILNNGISAGTSQFFFTPGVRYRFTPASRFSPYFGAGFGFGRFDGVNVASSPVRVRITDGVQPAAGFGGGVELRLGRGLAFRAEVRDYVACGANTSSRNHLVFQGGFSVHF